VLLADLVDTSEAVAATSSRNEKIALLASFVRRLAPEEAPIGVSFLSGELRQRQVGVGYAALREPPAAGAVASLTLAEVDDAFASIAAQRGSGSQRERRRLLHALFGRATGREQRFLRGLLGGGVRQGALDGVMVEAIARANGLPAAELRRALMLGVGLGPLAELARRDGEPGLRSVSLEPGRALQPMLAKPAADLDSALEAFEAPMLEWKLDGARVQVHRVDDRVTVFTRTADDVTPRVPEIVELALALPVRTAVFDGEAIALRPDGRPRPFQETASRFGSRSDVERLRRARPLTPFLFDVLHLDGEDLVDLPLAERTRALAAVVPADARVPRLESPSDEEAAGFLHEAVARGHEGVMVKSLASPYEAGRRGGNWLKVKPTHTLDLVVLAAEWGSGRRRGSLSNLHLGARDPRSGEFVMLGKTFKGLTDALLGWQTERLLELELTRDEWTVYVRPELVVEIAFDGVQRSSRYPGGVALRFARVKRYRPDKRASEADTIDSVRAITEIEHELPNRRGGV
jgi:DNA ligase-1